MSLANHSYEDCIVFFDGKPKIAINSSLLDQQNAWDNLEKIKEKHVERLDLEREIEKTKDRDLLIVFDALYTLIEFELQDLWGFPQDARYHKHWYRPKCVCPKIDNDDAYPTGYYVVNMSCPLHGDRFNEIL